MCIDSNLYAVAKLITLNSGSGSVVVENNNRSYSLYKLMLNDLLKSKTSIEHEILATNLDLNEEKFQIAIDSSVIIN